MKTAVIYARYSSERQTEQSIDGQLSVCNDYAARNDIIIVDKYIDRAMTGTNDNRTQFQKMLKDSAKQAWDIVLVYKLDRFSRNKYEIAVHRKTLLDNKIKIVSAMENIPDTPEGIILESLLEGMAAYYSAELSQKIKRGVMESRKKGNFTGGFLLYGYKVENKKIIVDEDKANIVRFIFEQYAIGTIIKNIRKSLDAQGITYRGKPFIKSTVHNILKNEKYSGITHFNGETCTDLYPQIVPTPIFEAVQNKIKSNKYGKRSIKSEYLLREKMICGYCGETVNAETGTARNGETKRYYKCSSRKTGKDCRKSIIRKELLENLVVDTTCQILNNPENIALVTDMIIQAHHKRLQDQSVIKILIKEQANNIKSIENVMIAIEKGIVTNSTKRRLEELELRQEEITAKIAIEKAKLAQQLTKEDIVQYIKTSLKKEPQLMIDLLINKIILYDDKIEIHYKYTKQSPDDDDQRDFSYKQTIQIKQSNTDSNKPEFVLFLTDNGFGVEIKV